MKIESSKVEKLRITELDRLDPITVILEDIGPRQGKIIIECYGESWTAYWGGMGDRTIAQFFTGCDEDYLAKKMSSLKSHVEDYDSFSEKFKKEICKLRRWKDLGKQEAREYFEDAGCIGTIEEARDNDRMLSRVFGEEWWYAVPEKPNPHYEYLRRIIRSVQAALLSTSVAKAA